MMHRVLFIALVVVACVGVVSAERVGRREAIRGRLRAQHKDQYGVLVSAAHETANCRALQFLFSKENVPGTVAITDFYAETSRMWDHELVDCDKLTRVGAIGAGVQGAAVQVMQAADRGVDHIKNFFNKVAAKLTKKPQAVYEKMDDAIKGLDVIWPAFVIGSREPDLPCSTRDTEAETCLQAVAGGGALSKIQGEIMKITNQDKAIIDIKTKKTELGGFSQAARDSHFGYMSIGHSMTADLVEKDLDTYGVVQILEDPSLMKHYKFPRRPTVEGKKIATPTQQDVSDFIVDYIIHLFDLAMTAVGKKDMKMFFYFMGRAGHTIMDSYSCAHTIRLADAAKNNPIVHYQDYGFQSGDKHATHGDDLPGKVPFKDASQGYDFGMEKVAKAYRIFMHSAVAVVDKSKYVPVFLQDAKVPAGYEKTGPGHQDLAAFLHANVYHFATDQLGQYSAKGCVTKSTVAPGKEAGICKASTTVLNAGSKICPDKPVDFATEFEK